MLLFKLVGLITLLAGLFIMKNFPDIGMYQRREMTISGIFLGALLFLSGIVLLVFG